MDTKPPLFLTLGVHQVCAISLSESSESSTSDKVEESLSTDVCAEKLQDTSFNGTDLTYYAYVPKIHNNSLTLCCRCWKRSQDVQQIWFTVKIYIFMHSISFCEHSTFSLYCTSAANYSKRLNTAADWTENLEGSFRHGVLLCRSIFYNDE